MKKIAVILSVVILVVSLVSFAFAAEMKKGTVKSADANAGTVVLSIGGSDVTLKADKSVDISKLKAGQKVEASIENDTLTSIKVAKPKAAVGC
jgi:cold shock CspA family protein